MVDTYVSSVLEVVSCHCKGKKGKIMADIIWQLILLILMFTAVNYTDL